MSIQIIKPQVLKHVASQLVLASFKKGHCCSDLSEDQISYYVNSWAFLNYQSFMFYWKEPETLALVASPESINAVFIPVNVPPLQFLRWLHGIRNNISISTIKAAKFDLSADHENAYLFLNKVITQLQAAIFFGLPEYSNAPENDVPPLESAL
ncbi:hypothetical protein [Chitinophaga filiformis]|uniref:Uncharacterized protein n=1 Tax=Chitinophaga filiformis TaxID=104663 RepID=A0A1G7MFR9_CHIFI|nr:hypothetical protein [Chitinophaga filiformis]SDF59969.1 hypothetical protein SAMN04488121_102388 [Chitinophaga filiformis]